MTDAHGDGNSSLTFESASFGGGHLTSSGVLLYVKDYLGSVRAVLDADSGALYKAVGYSAYGDDSSVSAIQVLPGGVGAVRAGAKAAAKADDVVDAARAVDNIKFKSFTARNFRDNLARLTGRMPDSNVHAHHIFPKGVKGFKKTSINPNDPRYGIWLDKDLHLGEGRSHKYNEAWDAFFETNPNPTTDELFYQARKLMKEIYETEVF